jgi:outer membrane protein TolC
MGKDRAVTGLTRIKAGLLAGLLLAVLATTSCALHPRGEREERERAHLAYQKHEPAALAADASIKDILEYAYAANADLEKLYWDWIVALEAIPQEASPGTNLAISFESMFEEGKTSLRQTTLGVGNDPMGNLPWPGKLTTAGRRSLEMARAAGRRFDGGKLALRTRVLAAYYDFALLGESIRIKETEVSILEIASETAGAGLRTGTASSEEVLRTRTDRDLAANEVETLKSRVSGQVAAINALLGRDSYAPLTLPKDLPAPRDLPYTDAQIMALLAERNPELAALANEAKGKEEAVKLMRQQYIPDLGLTLAGDLDGMAKSIMAMITAPIVRREAIQASIRQAQADLEASRAMRRQAESDLQAEAVLMLYDMRDAERQVTLLEGSIIPRLEEMVQISRTGYRAGKTPISELLDNERMLLETRLMAAQMRIEREKLLAQIEALAAFEP